MSDLVFGRERLTLRGMFGDELDQVISAGAGNRGRQLAHFELGHDSRKQRGQFGTGHPAEISALEGLRSGGLGDRRSGKVGAALDFGFDLLGLYQGLLCLLGCGIRRKGNQDLRQVILHLGVSIARLVFQVVIDFRWGYGDVDRHGLLFQLAQDELIADGVPEDVVALALGGEHPG